MYLSGTCSTAQAATPAVAACRGMGALAPTEVACTNRDVAELACKEKGAAGGASDCRRESRSCSVHNRLRCVRGVDGCEDGG